MPRRKFARMDYDLINRDLPLDVLGGIAVLKFRMVEHYFMDCDFGRESEGIDAAELERIPINSRWMLQITGKKKRDAQKKRLDVIAELMAFQVEYCGDSAWIRAPKWWKSEGLKPLIRDELPTEFDLCSGEREREPERQPDHEHERAPDGPNAIPPSEWEKIRGWRDRHRSFLSDEDLTELLNRWRRENADFEPLNPAAAFQAFLKSEDAMIPREVAGLISRLAHGKRF